MSADERREQILLVAVAEFGDGGYAGTSTETIAARAGVSQPYLFRLFGTKRDLFLAAAERGFQRVRDTFVAAARGDDPPGSTVLERMGLAYGELLADRETLRCQMQAYAAASDPAIQPVVRRHYAELHGLVRRLSGAEPEELTAFFAKGMLMNVAALLDFPELVSAESLEELCPPDTPA